MTWLQLADLRQSVSMPQKMLGRNRLLLACGIAALAAGSALARFSLSDITVGVLTHSQVRVFE
jgi:hypothetical protein